MLHRLKKLIISATTLLVLALMVATVTVSAQEAGENYNDRSCLLRGIIGNDKISDVYKALLIHDRLAS